MSFRDIAESILVAYAWRVLWIRDIIVFFDRKRVSDRVKGTPIASIVLRSYVLNGGLIWIHLSSVSEFSSYGPFAVCCFD